jgi:hypothetical protein
LHELRARRLHVAAAFHPAECASPRTREAAMEQQKKNPHIEAAKSFVTGMLAAQIAAVFTNPIDVVKTRLQIQGEAAAAAASGSASKATAPRIGVLGMFGHVARTEGILALQKGLVPSLLRETFYSSIRLSAYEPIRDLIMTEEERAGGASFAKKFAAGATAGAIGAGLANPADLVKVRMQAASGEAYVGGRIFTYTECLGSNSARLTCARRALHRRYSSSFAAFRSIYREGGVSALYRGTLPTVQRAAILTATQLGTYDHTKHAILERGWMGEGKPLHFVSGTSARTLTNGSAS